MSQFNRHSIVFRGRKEPVLETIRLAGKVYFVLENMSRRGAYRVFDPQAGPEGDYRVLYRFPTAKVDTQRVEILRRLAGPRTNRHFSQLIHFSRWKSETLIILSWVWGTNLRDYLSAARDKKTPRPSIVETVRLIRGITHGVGHYHRQTHLVHGDISPANLILSAGTTQLVLVDFGSAWPMEMSATRQPGDGATPQYAAPERTVGHAAQDFRADVFSLAAVAFELLTLEVPYDGLGGQAGLPQFAATAHQLYRPFAELAPQADRLPRKAVQQLEECLRIGLALHPDNRFGTRHDWLEAWDRLHYACSKGDRLSVPEHWVVRVVEAWMKNLSRRSHL